jgi:hypothetical protein
LCPNGLIETTPTILADGKLMFKARILKDKANPNSGEGVGHSMGKMTEEPKAFEKLETIAVVSFRKGEQASEGHSRGAGKG